LKAFSDWAAAKRDGGQTGLRPGVAGTYSFIEPFSHFASRARKSARATRVVPSARRSLSEGGSCTVQRTVIRRRIQVRYAALAEVGLRTAEFVACDDQRCSPRQPVDELKRRGPRLFHRVCQRRVGRQNHRHGQPDRPVDTRVCIGGLPPADGRGHVDTARPVCLLVIHTRHAAFRSRPVDIDARVADPSPDVGESRSGACRNACGQRAART